MGRPLSPRRLERALARLLCHRGLVTIEPYAGGAANRRIYGPAVSVKRALIADAARLTGDQYDKETTVNATVYFERSAVAEVPSPESRVTIWAGTPDERTAHVEVCGRYQHPELTDLLEVKLR
jgi:hypothetical protein